MKHTHTEGSSSILKSRLARGMVPLVATFLACALAAPEARAAYTTTVPSSLVNLTGTGTASTTGNIYNNEGPATAFDGKTGATRVIWNQKANIDLVYEFPSPTRVNAFRIWRSSQYERHPKTFRFEGLDVAGEWQKLDGDENLDKDTDWKPVSYRYYQFANPDHFTKYRLFIEANGGNQYTEFLELEMFCVDDETPAIATHSISANSATSLDVSVTMGAYAAETVVVKAIDASGAVAASADLGAMSAGAAASGTISGLTTGSTYLLRVDSGAGGLADHAPIGTFYTGTFSLSDVVDAKEAGCVPGSVTVSRAEADHFPLIVNYSFASSDAVEGQTYAAPTGYVVIPADARSAVIEVTPLVDMSVQSDTTITVSLAAGNYKLNGNETTSITIVNAVIPSDRNVWIAGASSDGLASTASNWSKGMPSASDPATLEILVSGDYSSYNMEWNPTAANGLATTVTSWTQTANYIGTVEIQTTYADGALPLLSIAGDCVVNGGKWTHTPNTNVANNASAQYRLNVSVGGDFTLGSAARIDLVGRGYNVGRCPSGSQVGVHAATARGTYSAVYGNVYAPEDVGSGGESGNKNTSSGGGAVKLVIAGAAVIDGSIAANAASQRLAGANPEKGYGAGGSVFITAGSISGSGTVDVSARPNGLSETAYTGYAGSGGRMALVATSGEVSIPFANLLANGSWGSYSAGAGTIFIKNSADANGSLLVGNNAVNWSYNVRYVRKDGCTCVKPGETWTFDHVYLRDSGILSVPENATLSLPGGFESVSSLTDSSTPLCGILYLGGTITLPAREEHVLSGAWMFMGAEPYTFNGDVRLTSKASIGSLQLYADSIAAYPSCNVYVKGDMTVESSASLYAANRGIKGGSSNPGYGYHGGNVANQTADIAKVYDSILNPALCGSGARGGDMGNTNPGGGAIVLTVDGALTLNGNANAGTTAVGGFHVGGAGTINITAGSLTGSGNITANGGSGSGAKSRGAGGGGRVAVRLTDAAATFDNFSGSITARGENANSATSAFGSSAGTVYLQEGSAAEGAGTIRVANLASSSATDAKTAFPSLSNGEPIDDLTNAKLEISNNSTVILIAGVKMSGLEIASGSKLDLNGKKLTVKSAKVNGVKLAPDTYGAGSDVAIGERTLGDYLVDTGTDGELIVGGVGLSILVR